MLQRRNKNGKYFFTNNKYIFRSNPDIIYFTLFILYAKKIKEKRAQVLLLISIVYVLCVMISQYNVFYYLMFYFLCYVVIKILYKEKAQVTDIFLILFSSLYLSLISFVAFQFVNKDFSNYYVIAIINKLALFIPFIFRNKFNIIYKKYCEFWNRNDKEKRPVKSITLRNMSMIILNCFLVISNLVFIYIQNNKVR